MFGSNIVDVGYCADLLFRFDCFSTVPIDVPVSNQNRLHSANQQIRSKNFITTVRNAIGVDFVIRDVVWLK